MITTHDEIIIMNVELTSHTVSEIELILHYDNRYG